MKQTRQIMGMPITIWLPAEEPAVAKAMRAAFAFFEKTDQLFSTYKPDSQISQLNDGHLQLEDTHPLVQQVLQACEDWRRKTNGFFNIQRDGKIDPSGLVKGWSIGQAASLLNQHDIKHYMIDASGDVTCKGNGPLGPGWRVGIRLPEQKDKVAKTIRLRNQAIATSGSYEQDPHIYNPQTGELTDELGSVSVIGPDIGTADVLATTIFATGQNFAAELGKIMPAGYEIYVITKQGKATATSGFPALAIS